MNEYKHWHEIAGLTIAKIACTDESVRLTFTNGSEYLLEHVEDCCEHVRFVKVEGDPQSLVGTTISNALNEHPGEPQWYTDGYDDSHTWETFEIRAGDVSVKWWSLGESNGYYGESMDFRRIQ